MVGFSVKCVHAVFLKGGLYSNVACGTNVHFPHVKVMTMCRAHATAQGIESRIVARDGSKCCMYMYVRTCVCMYHFRHAMDHFHDRGQRIFFAIFCCYGSEKFLNNANGPSNHRIFLSYC